MMDSEKREEKTLAKWQDEKAVGIGIEVLKKQVVSLKATEDAITDYMKKIAPSKLYQFVEILSRLVEEREKTHPAALELYNTLHAAIETRKFELGKKNQTEDLSVLSKEIAKLYTQLSEPFLFSRANLEDIIEMSKEFQALENRTSDKESAIAQLRKLTSSIVEKNHLGSLLAVNMRAQLETFRIQESIKPGLGNAHSRLLSNHGHTEAPSSTKKFESQKITF